MLLKRKFRYNLESWGKKSELWDENSHNCKKKVWILSLQNVLQLEYDFFSELPVYIAKLQEKSLKCEIKSRSYLFYFWFCGGNKKLYCEM